MAAESSATTVWEGDLTHGSGVTTPGSGAFDPVDVTWSSRTARSAGKTSPEELLAAAHSACFCMALSNELSTRGHPPTRLEVQATCTFQAGKGVTTMALDVSAEVPGVDEAGFREGLDAAIESCPVSNALRGNVDIQVDGTLA